MKPGVLVIRGGGIGDFILTLPAIALLRENFPGCRIEILAYRRVLGLVHGRYYADATRSIDYGPMAACFNPRAEINPELAAYFRSFAQIVSYIYDPDCLFSQSLRGIGVKNLLPASPIVGPGPHAAHQLASPLTGLGVFLDDPAPQIYPSAEDRNEAQRLLGNTGTPFIAIHPGSGSPSKNWPIKHWQRLIRNLHREHGFHRVVVVGGEADTERLSSLREEFPDSLSWLCEIPLEILGAILERASLFIGHDSGISHLASAAGARCLLLFGPTDPKVWAPAGHSVKILQHASRSLDGLTPDVVSAAAGTLLINA